MTAQDPWEHVRQAKQHIQDVVDAAEQQAASTERMNAELQATVVRKWSSRREAAVTIGADGLIQDLEFSHGAPHLSPLALARAVQSAHNAAVRELHEHAAHLTEKHLGDQPEVRDWLLSSYEDVLGNYGEDQDDPEPVR